MLERIGRERRRASSLRGLGAIVVLGLACERGGAQTPKAPSYEPLPLDRQVVLTVDVRAKMVSAEPKVFLQRLGGGVDFVAKGLSEGYTLEIDFKTQDGTRGPFSGGTPRGRYTLSAKAPSGPSGASDRDGYWKYEVVLRDASGKDVAAIDPGGVFK
jgi:hypothetical protein